MSGSAASGLTIVADEFAAETIIARPDGPKGSTRSSSVTELAAGHGRSVRVGLRRPRGRPPDLDARARPDAPPSRLRRVSARRVRLEPGAGPVRRGLGPAALARGGSLAGRDPGHRPVPRASAGDHARAAHREGELHVPEGAEVEIVETDRGGKSTYHGPGQLVCYPILDLKRHGQDVKRYCRDLEEALIRTLAAVGVEATRIEGLTGIWVDTPPPRKIASIGVHITKWVTTHGYALNVDLDTAPFTEWITACGLAEASSRRSRPSWAGRSPSTRSARMQRPRSPRSSTCSSRTCLPKMAQASGRSRSTRS